MLTPNSLGKMRHLLGRLPPQHPSLHPRLRTSSLSLAPLFHCQDSVALTPEQIPGLLHAWYIIAKYPDSEGYEPIDQEQGHRVTYVVISDSPRPSPPPQQHQQQTRTSYGATDEGGNAQAGSSQACPPSYAEVVAGDNKIQSP